MRASKLLYYDRAGVFKGTLAGGTQFGTPNDLKKTLRVSRGTFQLILNRIRYDLERDVYICHERCVTERNNGCEVNALLFD